MLPPAAGDLAQRHKIASVASQRKAQSGTCSGVRDDYRLLGSHIGWQRASPRQLEDKRSTS